MGEVKVTRADREAAVRLYEEQWDTLRATATIDALAAFHATAREQGRAEGRADGYAAGVEAAAKVTGRHRAACAAAVMRDEEDEDAPNHGDAYMMVLERQSDLATAERLDEEVRSLAAREVQNG